MKTKRKEPSMSRARALLLSAGLICGILAAAMPRVVADAGGVVRFATLPPGAPGHPEGLTADAAGNIYAASFELTQIFNPAAPAPEGPFPKRRKGPQGDPVEPFQHNYIYTFSPNGTLVTSTPLAPFVVPLGMVAVGSNLYVNDVINGDVLKFTLPLTPSSVPTTYDICGGFVVAFGAPGQFCAFNAIDVGPDARLFVSDNGAGDFGFTNGRIWVLDPVSGLSSVFFDSAELDVDMTGFPHFGVNGVAFQGSVLYMANMSTDKIYKLSLNCAALPCTPGALSLFIDGTGVIDGPDNIDFDDKGNLWIASGQNDTVVAVNSLGQIAKVVGSFEGFSQDGAPKGLLQPSGIVFSKGKIYIGNESNQTLRPATDPIDWSSLRAFTISRINP
jgi:sugar lactone lactonase YvrE